MRIELSDIVVVAAGMGARPIVGRELRARMDGKRGRQEQLLHAARDIENRPSKADTGRPDNRIQYLPSQPSARARRKALSRALRVSAAAASNSDRASAGRPARNRQSPLAAGNGA